MSLLIYFPILHQKLTSLTRPSVFEDKEYAERANAAVDKQLHHGGDMPQIDDDQKVMTVDQTEVGHKN